MSRQTVPQQEKPVTTASASGNNVSSVLLPMATVWASGNAGRVLVRILFNTGSERTFVCSGLVYKLDLPSSGTNDLTVFTFGDSNRPRHYHCQKLKVTLASRFESKNITLDALQVPEVCAVLSSPMEPALVSALRSRNLVIADKPPDGEE